MAFENGKLVRVVLRASLTSGLSQVTVLHYNLEDQQLGTDPNDPQALADTIRDDVIPSYKALFHSSYSIDPVVVTEEKDPLNPEAAREQWTSGTTQAGTRTGMTDGLPPGLCGLAKLRTAKIGRSFTGRIFLPGHVAESDIASTQWSTSITGPWDTFLAAIPRQPDISPPLSTSTCRWCVYSRTRRARDQDPYAEAITEVVRTNKFAYLRSRRD